MVLTPALKRQSSEFEVSLVYRASARTARVTQRKKKRVKGSVVNQGWPVPTMICQGPKEAVLWLAFSSCKDGAEKQIWKTGVMADEGEGPGL